MRAFIFDFDGVLVESGPLQMKFVHHVAEHFGVTPLPESDYKNLARQSFDVHYDRMGIPWEKNQGRLRRMFIDFMISQGMRVSEDDCAVLRRLKESGLALGIASMNSHEVISAVLRDSGLKDLFSAIATIEDVTRHKPHPDVLLVCAKRMGMLPCDCAYVGDLVTDVQAAKAAGMMAIAKESYMSSGLADSGPDASVASLAQLSVCLATMLK
ncbi:hypothetical protein COY28_06820 [Candidatus Woesearchaeota archaeon CG_4_10_14_0_2_um_filter_57_5]|nr:MAG: hypothetical protein AUJ68_01955 [Candidatus Woesearchaeota archaeon CG1_02_57_44]PIN70124.1 MAG: hypothetical protein COV94_02055 [Candidatus Woesearchaeota archaeon CG11_big_fil_rev_8_21_14_0_20_57_5]PIZ48889.1 MAG: hypothetical protein COY28_06820 [Candidatus Woesearchaeota archaeon CG_4_10_14_0_2_um_filter_57_5]